MPTLVRVEVHAPTPRTNPTQVYHLTDVPSFCSGEYMVMFDPHACYIPGVSVAQPGEGPSTASKRAEKRVQFALFAANAATNKLRRPCQGTYMAQVLGAHNTACRIQRRPSHCLPARQPAPAVPGRLFALPAVWLHPAGELQR